MAKFCNNCLNEIEKGDARHGDSFCAMPMGNPYWLAPWEYKMMLARDGHELVRASDLR